MTSSTDRPPVHESLTVVDAESIYRNEDWWKAVVKYRFEDSSDATEIAVYLWHHDDGWTRKNKYVIKTKEAWETDRDIITQLLSGDLANQDSDSCEEYPVSDFYEVADGVTIFNSKGWWKAILNIEQKGDYETNEVMVYLWQKRDEEWKRRQKYTIKSMSDWETEAEIVESMLGSDPSTEITTQDTENPDTLTRPSEQFQHRSEELEAHLSNSMYDSK